MRRAELSAQVVIEPGPDLVEAIRLQTETTDAAILLRFPHGVLALSDRTFVPFRGVSSHLPLRPLFRNSEPHQDGCVMKTREEIMSEIVRLLKDLADDWDYTGEITPETRLFADMGLASLDLVVLGMAVQESCGQTLPFPELFAEVGQRDNPDIPIGEWVDFIHKHLHESARASR